MSALTPLAQGLYAFGGYEKLVAGAHLPARSVVVDLPEGLLLYAPLAIDDALAAELAALGPVRWLLAPNGFHHRHQGPARARYPDAEVWLCPGLRQKRPDLRADHWLIEEPTPEAWAPTLAVTHIDGGPKFQETCLLHTPTQTLIVTDLLFNVHAARGWLASTILRLGDAWRKLSIDRMVRWFISDKARAAAGVAELLRWDFERVVMAHGEILEGPDVHARVEAAAKKVLRWAKG